MTKRRSKKRSKRKFGTIRHVFNFNPLWSDKENEINNIYNKYC